MKGSTHCPYLLIFFSRFQCPNSQSFRIQRQCFFNQEDKSHRNKLVMFSLILKVFTFQLSSLPISADPNPVSIWNRHIWFFWAFDEQITTFPICSHRSSSRFQCPSFQFIQWWESRLSSNKTCSRPSIFNRKKKSDWLLVLLNFSLLFCLLECFFVYYFLNYCFPLGFWLLLLRTSPLRSSESVFQHSSPSYPNKQSLGRECGCIKLIQLKHSTPRRTGSICNEIL